MSAKDSLSGDCRIGNLDVTDDLDELEATITTAPDAAVCGTVGCRKTDDLFKVVHEGSQRVLCKTHVRDYLEVDV